MDSDDSTGSLSEDSNTSNSTTAQTYTSSRNPGSKTRLQNLRSQTNSKLLHLGKTLLAYNTHETHKYALEIAALFLSGIPPDSHMPEDLFTYLVSILHIHFKEERTDKIFQNFLSVTATTTPHLRPLVLEHSVRLLAVKNDIAGIVEEVTRRCNEWNLEVHEVARHYKWVVKHMEFLTNFDSSNVPEDFTMELEDVLYAYLEHRRLPNKNLINLYTRIRGHQTLRLINKYIAAFPTVYFLRFNRLKITLSRPQNHRKSFIVPLSLNHFLQEEDLISFVRLSGYLPISVDFLYLFRHFVSSDKLVQLLLDLVITVPHLKKNWNFLYSIIRKMDGLSADTLTTLERPEFLNLFDIYGNICSKLPPECFELYSKVASLFFHKDHVELLRKQYNS